MPTVLGAQAPPRAACGPLLAYRAGRGDWRDVSSDEINSGSRTWSGADYSAKDFRTWNGTVLAAVKLAGRTDAPDRAKAVTAVIEEVADILGNTPAVCRASYVDPRVVSKYKRGRTIAAALKRLEAKGTSGDFADRVGIERAVIKLLA